VEVLSTSTSDTKKFAEGLAKKLKPCNVVALFGELGSGKTTFVAYLSTILQGFKAFQIEESAKEIIKNVEKLQGHIKAYDNYHAKLGNSLATTVNHYNTSRKEFKKIDKDVLRITGESSEVEELVIDKPNNE